MRMYFFNNHYLGPMQHGIQAAHCLGEVTLRFSDPTDPVHAQLRQWLDKHKTMIILNGGYESSLKAIYACLGEISDDLVAAGHPALAFAKFHEEQDALAGCLTSVGVIVPSNCYSERTNRQSVLSMRQLRKRADLVAEELELVDSVEVASLREHFTPHERLTLLCAGFPLAG